MSLLTDASLVLVPSAIKTGEVLVQKPLPTKFSDETGNYDGNDPQGSANLTFTRNSNATRVNSSGLVEKVRTNLLLHSNTFSTTWLPLSGGAVTGGQAGYDGTNNAWLLSKSAAGGFIYQTANSFNGQYTISIYAKANASTYIRVNGNAITDGDAFFNLSTGAVHTSSNCTARITSVGSGWYRCSISSNDADLDYVNIYPAEASGISATSGSVFIQNAQLETGNIATAYIPTTTSARSTFAGITVDGTSVPNVARLDYSGGATCGKLLLEPQRSNLALWSETFNNAAWIKSGSGGTITANYGISPDGYQNAERYTATSGSRYVVYQSVPVSSGSTYTVSMYAKSLSGSQKIRIGADSGCANPQGAQTFTVGETWTRISTTITSTQTSWNVYVDNVESGSACTGTYLTADFLIYGFQCELGSYETSLIPTLGASVTRLADACSKTGISSLIGQTEGTLFVELTIDRSITSTDRVAILSDGTGNERIGISLGATNLLYAFVVDGGATTAEILRSGTTAGTYKAAFAYKANDFAFYVNGSLVGTDTSGSVASCSRLDLGNQLGSNFLGGEISQALLFTSRLSNADLANLTAL